MKTIHRRILKVTCGVLLVVLVTKCAILGFTWDDPINQFRRSLTERYEHRSASDEFGDYSLYITGRLSLSRFKEMAELLGLGGKLRIDPKQLEGWQQIAGEKEWDLPSEFDQQYHDEGTGYSVLLGRSDDRVFYQYLSW